MNASRCTAVAAALIISTAVIGSARAEVSLGVTIDPLQIGNAIAGAVNANQSREACIANLANATDYQTQYKSNILVVNQAQHPYLQSNNIVFYGSAECGGALVGVWAFGNGEFTHEGDGGYINWYMIGNFHRDGDGGKHVVFYPR